MSEATSGVVLAGAAALGAYEAGVLDHVVRRVGPEVGRRQLFDVISGTSAGAINAAELAAFADDPAAGATRLCETWSELVLGQTIRPATVELLLLALEAPGVPSQLARALKLRSARGGLFDPRSITSLLTRKLPLHRVGDHLVAGRLRALALSATHVATGKAAVFYQTAGEVAPWTSNDDSILIPTEIGVVHAMASAAIPLVFPPVVIGGEIYCDGGLRQLVPLSPSLHLGARRLLVVNPLAKQEVSDDQARRDATTSPLYLAGKALNALFLDRTEVDVARVDQLSNVLRAGRRRFGPTFDAELNAELGRMHVNPLHEVTTLRIGPSRDLGKLAVELVTSSAFAKRERGLVGHAMRCLAQSGPTRTGDLLSYLLFDGAFAAELIALGRADARAHHAELCELFAAPERTARAG